MTDNKNQSPLLKAGLKFWLKGFQNFTLGPGDVRLMESLLKTENLTDAASECGYSYKYAWQKLKNIAKRTSKEVVITQKGGYGGGGKVILTEWGKYLISQFNLVASHIEECQAKLDQLLLNHPFSE